MAFRIILAGSKTDPIYARDEDGHIYEYETGAEAQERAKELALRGDGSKWRV